MKWTKCTRFYHHRQQEQINSFFFQSKSKIRLIIFYSCKVSDEKHFLLNAVKEVPQEWLNFFFIFILYFLTNKYVIILLFQRFVRILYVKFTKRYKYLCFCNIEFGKVSYNLSDYFYVLYEFLFIVPTMIYCIIS